MKKQTILLGSHVSGSEGLYLAFERAIKIGCSVMQIFTKSNQQWQAKPLTNDDIELFLKTKKNNQSNIHAVVAHAAYLINLASENPITSEKSILALKTELERCSKLEIPYLVFHPGSAGKQNRDQALCQLYTNINTVLANYTGQTMLLLENMAGQGSSLCSNFNEIKYILENIKKKNNIGICLDTCHAFAAGYDFTTQETYINFFKEFHNIIGLEHLKIIHLNDSKKEIKSHVDRHEEIGKGKIGIQTFSLFMNDPHLINIPKIIELPDNDKENIQLLLSLIKK